MLTKNNKVHKHRMCLAKQQSYIDQSEARTWCVVERAFKIFIMIMMFVFGSVWPANFMVKCRKMVCILLCLYHNFPVRVFTFTHLEDTFIQRNLHRFDVLVPNFDENQTHDFGFGMILLFKLQESTQKNYLSTIFLNKMFKK